MKKSFIYVALIIIALIGIFILRKPSPARIDLIPVNEQGEEYTDEPSIDDMKKIIINTDTIYAVVNTGRFNIDEKIFSKNIAIYNKQNIEAIRKDYSSHKSIVKEYIDFFVNSTDEEQLKKAGLGKPAFMHLDQIVNNLKLLMIEVRPEEENPGRYYIFYMYQITGIYTEDIHLSVMTDADGGNIDIYWET